jgi:hypothetical protein
VVPGELVPLRLFGVGNPDDTAGERLMQRRSPPLRHGLVGSFTDQPVPEHPGLLRKGLLLRQLNELAPGKRGQRRQHVAARQFGDGLCRELDAADRRGLGDCSLRGLEPVETAVEQAMDRVGYAPHGAVVGGGEELLQEQRVPFGRGENSLSRRRPRRGWLEPVEHRLGVSLGQRFEQQGRAVHPSPSPIRTQVNELRSGEAEDEYRAARQLRDLLDKVEEGRRGPVDVIEHQHERFRPRQLLQKSPNGPCSLLDRARIRTGADGRRDTRGDELALALPDEELAQPDRRLRAGHRGHDLAQRRERRIFLIGHAASEETGRRTLLAARQLGQQPALADAGSAVHRDKPDTPLRCDGNEDAIELCDLVLAADERRVEPPWERGGGSVEALDPPGIADAARRHRMPDEAQRALCGDDVTAPGGSQQPTGLRDHGARDERLARFRVSGDHLAGCERRGEPPRAQLERCPDRAQPVVVVGGRHPEDTQHAVASKPLCRSPVTHHGRRRLIPLAFEHVAACLGVERVSVAVECRDEHGDGLPRLGRRASCDWDVGGCGRRADRRVLLQDRAVEFLQFGSRLGAELVDEYAPRRGVGLERVRLTSRPVQGEDQLVPESLAERMFGDERLQLRHQLDVAGAHQVDVDTRLLGGDAQLVEVGRRRCDVLVGQVGEYRSAPERERAPQQRCGLLGLGRLGLGNQTPKPIEVELVRLDVEPVAGRAGLEPVAEHAPQPPHVVLQ